MTNDPARPNSGSRPPSAVGATLRLPAGAPPPHQLPRRKTIRLARHVYDGVRAYSITISTKDRRRAFADPDAITEALYALDEASRAHSFTVLAYCLMPDHAHLLVVGGTSSNLIDFMKRFKQISGFGYKQRTGRQLWQKGYFDHVIRAEEALEEVAKYIFANPVRAGLVVDPAAYRLSGGEYFEPMLGGQPEGSPYKHGASS